MNLADVAMVGVPQGWELVLIVLVILLLFGAAKLPQLARGTGQALRIFKTETKGLRDDDKPADERDERTEPRGITSGEQSARTGQTAQTESTEDPVKRPTDG